MKHYKYGVTYNTWLSEGGTVGGVEDGEPTTISFVGDNINSLECRVSRDSDVDTYLSVGHSFIGQAVDEEIGEGDVVRVLLDSEDPDCVIAVIFENPLIQLPEIVE